MKKYIVTLVLTAFQVAVVAQTVNVHFKNGQTIEYSSDNIDYVDFSPKASEPTLTPGQVVDLGLSVYWASCNLGAESPEEFGNYYAWGETSPKSKYSKENYSFYNSSTDNYIDIGDNISGTEYDAATVNIGSDWRMPTKEQLQELLDNCTWEWTQVKEVNGYRITGKNGKSIFIPSTGYKLAYTSEVGKKTSFIIWSANIYSMDGFATSLNGSLTNKPSLFYGTAKYEGICIRPVTTNLNAGNSHAGQ